MDDRSYGSRSHKVPFSSSTTKIPPGWSPEYAHQYSLKSYLKDFRMWYQTTELSDQQIGPAMALRLDGVARRIADQIASQSSDVDEDFMSSLLSHGRYELDALGHRAIKQCWTILIEELKDRFSQTSEERLIQHLHGFFTFRVNSREDIDSYLDSSLSKSRVD